MATTTTARAPVDRRAAAPAGVWPALRLGPVAVLTAWLVLLVGVPATLIFKPLGASGTPANILGIGCLIWWAATRLAVHARPTRTNPVRLALLGFGLAILASLAAMSLRAAPGIESSSANRAALVFLGGCGVALVSIDGLRSVAEVEQILRRFVGAATFLACTGLLQAATGFELAARLRIPGLHVNDVLGAPVEARGHFTRIQGTASHPIEFGVVLAMAFPLAVHFAMAAPAGRRRGRIACCALIALGIPLSLSRSGLLGLIVASLTLLVTWSWRQRANALVVLVVFAGLTRAAIPGLLGTVVHLFSEISGDTSTRARTSRYATIGHYFLNSPFTGRGFGTFLPQNYIFVDNQYLMTAVDMGAIGVVALLALLAAGVGCARGARRRARSSPAGDSSTAGLGQALVGALLATAVSFATYDAFSFPIAIGATFLLLGAAGALWRLVESPLPSATTSSSIAAVRAT